MSTTFIIALILAVIVLSNLRFFLLVAAAVILALVVTGVGAVSGALGNDHSAPTVVAPAQQGPAPDNPEMQSDNPPAGQPEPPR